MICHECGQDDKEKLSDDMPVTEMVRLCREWRCKSCRRTPEEVQADYDATAARKPHKSAHDWDTILKGSNVELTGAAPHGQQAKP